MRKHCNAATAKTMHQPAPGMSTRTTPKLFPS